jgi:hypothetical protein
MESKESEIAKTILIQLGGPRFIAMTGARYFIAHPDGSLSFRLPLGYWNHVRITLTPMDVYTVAFQRVRRPKHGSIPECRDALVEREVYAEDLVPTVERVTGLRLSL